MMSEPRVRLPLRIPASLKAKLKDLAEREHRSLNKQIEFLLARSVQEETTREAGESLRPNVKHGKRK